MPPVRRSTAKERHQEIMNLMMQGISRVNVRILRTLHRAHGLPQPMAPCRPLSPCFVAARAVRGVGNRSRSPRRSRSRELELSGIGSRASSHASSAVPTSYGSGGEIALVPCRRATVKRPHHVMSRDALRVAKASPLSEGIDPRGKVTKRAKEVMDQWKLEEKERFEQEKKRARQGEAQRRNHEQSLRPSAELDSD